MAGKVPLVGLDKIRESYIGADHIIKMLKQFDGEPVIEAIDDTSFVVNDRNKQLELCEWLGGLPRGCFSVEETPYANIDHIHFVDRDNAIKFKLRFGDLKTPKTWQNFTILKQHVTAKSRKISAQYTWDESFSMSISNPNKPKTDPSDQ